MIDDEWRTVLLRQFDAAIDMFASALRDCPDELWEEPMWPVNNGPLEFSAFWYVAYHTLFWLDLYLTGQVEGFQPPEPFTLAELDPAGVLPERVYTPAELLNYLDFGRQKCQVVIAALTDEQARRLCRFSWGELTFAGLLIDNMRHVQEHGAQLRMFIGQRSAYRSRWNGGARRLS